MSKTVLVSGAGVAGPALAYWLNRRGYEVTVVERASSVRAGGYAVDFRGAALDVLDRMGILAEMRSYDTKMGPVVVVDTDGQRVAELPVEHFSGELEVNKSDLVRVLHELTRDDVEYVFSDSVRTISRHADGAEVTFERSPARSFDLVVGADGSHSAVRKAVFGPAEEFTHRLGMAGVGFSTDNFLGLRRQGMLRRGSGGTAVYLFSGDDPSRVTVSLSFGNAPAEFDQLTPEVRQKITAERFAGDGWEVPRLLQAMRTADDFYSGSAHQIKIDRWSEGRVVLLGDAGYCAAPTSGMGTSQALIGAYVLAGELATTNGDHALAFANYERELRDYVERNQVVGAMSAQWFNQDPDEVGTEGAEDDDFGLLAVSLQDY